MFNAFTWMFKTENFKKHFLILFLLEVLVYASAFVAKLILTPCNEMFIRGIVVILSLLLSLYIMGYFWNLTEQVINREHDICANNIYNGKITKTYKITLPELKITDNIWRGFASTIAILLLILPLSFIMYSGTQYGVLETMPIAAKILIPLFICSFIPALLWNYAHKSSVVAVWNLRKAIYLMGNYTLGYIINTLLLIIVMSLESGLDYILTLFLQTVPGIITGVIVSIVVSIKTLYLIYVFAYLLGTITPTSEA